MTDPTTAPNAVLVVLAAKHPELDAIRWRVTLADNSYAYIAGERVEVDPEEGGRLVLRFALDDGTTREFRNDEWTSLRGMPGKVEPVLDQIIRRLHDFGLATTHDILNQGGWLQAQPEWIEDERRHLADDPTALADMERIHALRTMGF